LRRGTKTVAAPIIRQKKTAEEFCRAPLFWRLPTFCLKKVSDPVKHGGALWREVGRWPVFTRAGYFGSADLAGIKLILGLAVDRAV
jgi:hypothetical protein